MGVSSDSKLEWVTSFYDPLANCKVNGGPAAGIGAAFLLLPQDRELATYLYESAANATGWNALGTEIHANATALLLIRELGDHGLWLDCKPRPDGSTNPGSLGTTTRGSDGGLGSTRAPPGVSLAP